MSSRYVLIVDDHPVNATLVQYTLEVHDIETRVAHDAEETFAAIEHERPALVLMDVQLPGMDGLTLTRKLRSDPRYVDLPIVALTAYAMPSDERAAREAGCDAFVSKPIDTVALGELVVRLLASQRAVNGAHVSIVDTPIGRAQPAKSTSTALLPADAPFVLVVEDDPMAARAIARRLEGAGNRVKTLSRADPVLGVLATSRVDAIVTDLNMPHMSGIELLRELRRRGWEIPVIILTGDPSVESAIRAMEYGAQRYLLKADPSGPAIEDAVREAVTMGRLAHARREASELLARPSTEQARRSDLDARFRAALDGLSMAFQPIVQVDTKQLFAYEALMRSREPSLPHPGAVLAAAEELQAIHALGRTTRNLSAREIEGLPRGPLCFVNLHAADLTDPDLYREDAPLSAHASRVVLELTERASTESIADLPERVARLRALGFRVAIDDLGAGYAGLQYFAHITPEFAKLDMSLVRDIERDPVKQRVVLSLTQLCRHLAMGVIAEGVETVAERDALAAIGCDALQGYCFARPGPPFPSFAW